MCARADCGVWFFKIIIVTFLWMVKKVGFFCVVFHRTCVSQMILESLKEGKEEEREACGLEARRGK